MGDFSLPTPSFPLRRLLNALPDSGKFGVVPAGEDAGGQEGPRMQVG